MATTSNGDGAVTTRYYSLADYLSPKEATGFFSLSHAEQVAKVAEYLEFLGRQPAAEHFTASARAAVAHAQLRAGTDGEDTVQESEGGLDGKVMALVLAGKTRSGFGAFGTDAAFLLQKPLSLTVARVIEEIGHQYAVETQRRKRTATAAEAVPPPPVLNSRSFFFYWCHAEKQKLVDVRQKLAHLPRTQRVQHWEALEIVVDRAMCDDCVAFCEQLAVFEGVQLVVRDPQRRRVFGRQLEGRGHR